MSSPLVIRRVWIEKADCTGHALCVPEAPRLIAYDQHSAVSVVQQQSLERTQQNLKLLLEAAAVRPMSAFFVEVGNGTVFNVSNELIQRQIRAGQYRWA